MWAVPPLGRWSWGGIKRQAEHGEQASQQQSSMFSVSVSNPRFLLWFPALTSLGDRPWFWYVSQANISPSMLFLFIIFNASTESRLRYQILASMAGFGGAGD